VKEDALKLKKRGPYPPRNYLTPSADFAYHITQHARPPYGSIHVSFFHSALKRPLQSYCLARMDELPSNTTDKHFYQKTNHDHAETTGCSEHTYRPLHKLTID